MQSKLENIKKLTNESLKIEEQKAQENELLFRVGIGYDIHQLVESRPLILGGVMIPHDKGLLGHSDADVLVHAIMDSMLSALALNDIGYYFPNTDVKFKDIDSLFLLKTVYELICKNGYKINNISATILCEKPKVLKYKEEMKSKICEILKIDKSQIGISATTSETVGLVGHEEAIAVYCISSLKKTQDSFS